MPITTATYDPGDLVQWERKGWRGHYLCRVIGHYRTRGKLELLVEVLQHEWNPLTPLKGQQKRVSSRQLVPYGSEGMPRGDEGL